MPVNTDDIYRALDVVGLKRTEVDHGMLSRELAIVVYEYGLFQPTNQSHYFSIGHSLYVGGAVLYGIGDGGETVDVKVVPPVMFYRDGGEVERAIELRQIERPTMAVNGEVLWQWPNKAPKGMGNERE
jgi:hypothetical protein